MADMKFKFTIQPYQTEAVESVVGVFAGQPFNDRFTYRRDINVVRDVTNWTLSDDELYMGFANARMLLDFGQLLENIRRVQTRNNIKLSDALTTDGLDALIHYCKEIEPIGALLLSGEWGCGKTYMVNMN